MSDKVSLDFGELRLAFIAKLAVEEIRLYGALVAGIAKLTRAGIAKIGYVYARIFRHQLKRRRA